MVVVNARQYVGTGFPPEEGAKLAEVLMGPGYSVQGASVDLRKCPAGLLISAFFNAFLQRVHEKDPALLDAARKIHWELEYDFQKQNVARWMQDFKPFNDSSADA
jgi:hypothetical protein